MELNALLGQPVALPSLPRTVALLMNELAQRGPSLRRLNLLFGSDPVLPLWKSYFGNSTSSPRKRALNCSLIKSRSRA